MKLLIPFFLVLTLNCFSQSLAFNGGGAWQSSIGGIVSTTNGINSLYANPAGLLELENSFGIDLSVERRFNLSELSTYSAGGYYSLDKSVIGLSLVRFGYEDYTEQKINLTYARKLFDQFSFGANFTYIQYLLNEFGNKGLISFDIGIKSDVNKVLSIGAFVNNPASLKFDDNQDIPVRLAIGTNYHPSNKVEWMVELEKIIDNDLTIKTGIVYYPAQQISLRIGGDITRNLVGIGIGYNLNGFKVTGAYSLNQVLGNFPSLSLAYESKKHTH
jgi:hypothetical protein